MPRKSPGRKAFNDPNNLPPEMMVENLPRRRFSVVMENSILSFNLNAGRDDKNVVLNSWKHPIHAHDKQVLEVERLLVVSQEKERDYRRDLRTFRNWDTGWLLMNERPDDLDEYIVLKEDMKDFHERIKFIKTVEEKVEAEDQWRRFKELESKCEKLLEAQAVLERVRETKEQAFKISMKAHHDLEAAKEKERELADQISDDHVEADARGVGIPELFPTVNTGFIISKINGIDLEDMVYAECLEMIAQASTPHELEFRRYDYRQDMMTGEWQSLQEMRLEGMYVEDPRVKRNLFVEAGRMGDVGEIKLCLLRGEDVDAADGTHCSALHHAAASGHFEVMQVLLDAGASIEFRDMNMEPVLIHACRRGDMRVVEWLLEHGANIDVRDRGLRTPLFHAIISKNLELVKMLVERRTSLSLTDKVWKWSPLHYSASVGSVEITTLLLKRRASPYALSEHGWTPQRCAEENSCHDVVELIKEYVFNEPAQRIIVSKDPSVEPSIWMGCAQAAYPKWATDRGFQAICSIYRSGRRDPKHRWIGEPDEDRDIKWHHCEIDIKDTSTSPSSWQKLLVHLPRMLTFINMAVEENRELLIHCETGISTSFLVVAVYMLIKKRLRVPEILEHMTMIRRQVLLAPCLALGIEQVQQELDDRKLQRLESRLRNSHVISLGF